MKHHSYLRLDLTHFFDIKIHIQRYTITLRIYRTKKEIYLVFQIQFSFIFPVAIKPQNAIQRTKIRMNKKRAALLLKSYSRSFFLKEICLRLRNSSAGKPALEAKFSRNFTLRITQKTRRLKKVQNVSPKVQHPKKPTRRHF